MAFNVDDKVLVVDQSSGYRNKTGVVKSVSGDLHQVRLEGHGCNSRVPLDTDQLRSETSGHDIDYSLCSA